MSEITQADRDAAARKWAEDNDEPLDCYICEQIRAGYGDNSLDVIRFADHRMEERAAIVAWLRKEQAATESLRDEMDRFTAGYHMTDEHASALEQSADSIEAGEHLK